MIFCGTILTHEGKEELMNVDFEAFRPINRSLYYCGNKFDTEVKEDEGNQHCQSISCYNEMFMASQLTLN